MYMIMGLLPYYSIECIGFQHFGRHYFGCLSYDLYLMWLLEQPDNENKGLLDEDDENTSSSILGVPIVDNVPRMSHKLR